MSVIVPLNYKKVTVNHAPPMWEKGGIIYALHRSIQGTYACYVTPPPVPLPLSSVLIKRIGTPKLCANGWKFPKKRKKIEAALRSRKATSICFR